MPIRFVYMTIALKSIPNTYCFPDKEIRAIPVVPIFIRVGRITRHPCMQFSQTQNTYVIRWIELCVVSWVVIIFSCCRPSAPLLMKYFTCLVKISPVYYAPSMAKPYIMLEYSMELAIIPHAHSRS